MMTERDIRDGWERWEDAHEPARWACGCSRQERGDDCVPCVVCEGVIHSDQMSYRREGGWLCQDCFFEVASEDEQVWYWDTTEADARVEAEKER